MRAAGVSRSTEAKAWTVISSALSWAVEDDSWPLSMNGCLTMQRRRGMRRASRRAGTGAIRQVSPGKRRDDLPSWALSPLAVERIRLVMLERLEQRSSLLALRDATAVSVQYGLGMRNQEIWALTLGDIAARRATVREVLSYGALDAGKTEGAAGRARRPPIDALLADDLAAWKAALAAAGYPTAPDDFLLRGDLGGHGAGEGHMTGSQADKWPGKYFTPAVRRVAEEWPDEHSEIIGATPYSLRRGMISLRIRAGEDRQAIAKQCGTGVKCSSATTRSRSRTSRTRGPTRRSRADPCPGAGSGRKASRAAGCVSPVFKLVTWSPVARRERRLRLPAAAAHRDFAAPVQPETGQRRPESPEIPANALLAQLVEHFHGKEGVVGSESDRGLWPDLQGFRHLRRLTLHGPFRPFSVHYFCRRRGLTE